MNYLFVPTNRFKSDLKTLQKANPNIDSDLKEFLKDFNHRLGDYIAGTGCQIGDDRVSSYGVFQNAKRGFVAGRQEGDS